MSVNEVKGEFTPEICNIYCKNFAPHGQSLTELYDEANQNIEQVYKHIDQIEDLLDVLECVLQEIRCFTEK